MSKTISQFDWLSILLYFLLVSIGWVNIYSASLDDTATSFFDLDQIYGKQLLWIILSVFLIVILLSLEAKFYERFASIIYVFSLFSIIGLFFFGKTINGATSWYAIGGFTIQPSEFAKVATALALAKFTSDIQTNIKNLGDQFKAFIIIALPALIILPQPDAGSAMVYAAFFFPLYREGLSGVYLLIGALGILVFVLTLMFNPFWVSGGAVIVLLLTYFLRKKKKPGAIAYLSILIVAVALSFSVNYIFENIFEQRHRDRFNIVLGKEVDNRGIGYNTNQSEIAIGSGSWFGKGWTQGTQTKGNFVPEQHTDYIFSTVGEEWGFIGSTVVVLLFILLMLRILHLAERQKSQFNRVYGYSVAGILFIHFFVNVGMVIGIFPTVGIPLPFFSYGGSGLWGFTILLFIFIKLDADRMSFW
ncbi:rod shape determining protein RodA [Salinimicrobium catena]|uniref:Rod shape determining protein RodA n=1 Tax=Salinimicrobium catena TaxID=390640 RepID=A0A1H5JYM8_9FLAO|nr:rod shape-determining protein RodA [Salinimicrobium catena]SDK91996.1 rod shape determining protein RodA [Salinimicrobium catena]SEE57656.1 rod shape determining protein RodA [Salinimicrobium catena]